MLLLCLFAGFVAFAPGASAHHPLVTTGSAVCGPEVGDWTVSGTAVSWVGDTEAAQTNANVVLYWAAASADVAWPAVDAFAVPAGATSGDSGAFNAGNGFAFDYSFVVPASSGLAVGDVVEVVAHTAAPWADGGVGGQWWGIAAGVPTEVVLTSQTDCEPPPCESDPTLPADDPACGVCEEGEVGEFPECAPACESDPTLPADDPACGVCEEGEVGEFPECAPACESDPTLPADDPACGVCEEGEVGEFPECAPACESDPTLPADDPGCEVVLGNVVTPGAQLPRTGAGTTTGLLALAGALLLVGLVLITGARRREARLS